MKFLSPLTLAALEVAADAIAPVPSGGAGSLAWSPTAGAPVVWDGAAWRALGQFAGGTGGGRSGGGFTLEFTAGSLPSGASLARASSGTRINSSGTHVIETSNVARFDYDPLTHAPLGLLIEPGATNLLVRSAEFDDPAWNKAFTTISANAATAPDGSNTADALIATSANSHHYSYQAPTFADGDYTLSLHAKTNGYAWPLLYAFDGASDHLAFFDVTNGVLGTVTRATAEMQALASAWYRCIAHFTVSGGGSGDTGAKVCAANGTQFFAGDDASGIFAWGAQLEAGSVATSYIPTAGATATRAADALTITVPAGYSSLFVTYDDDSTGTVACAEGANTYHASDFSRTRIKSIEGVV